MADSADQTSRDAQNGIDLGRAAGRIGGKTGKNAFRGVGKPPPSKGAGSSANYMKHLQVQAMRKGTSWRLLFKGVSKGILSKLIIVGGPVVLIVILICCLITALPGIFTNELFGINSDTMPTEDLFDVYEEFEDVIGDIVQNAYEASLAQVNLTIDTYVDNMGYDRELSQASTIDSSGGYTSAYNTSYILACYSVMKGNDNLELTIDEMINRLNSVAASMFPITATTRTTQRYTATAIPDYTRVYNLLVVAGEITTPTGATAYRTVTTDNYYAQSGTITITEPTDRPVYQATTVKIPKLTSGSAVTSYTTATYYLHTGRWQTVYPDIIDVNYLQCTINPFNSLAIEDAFEIDRDAMYEGTEQTVGEAIDAMANALNQTLYGTHSGTYSGSVGTLEGVEAEIASYLLGQGFTVEATAAVLGNLKAESSMDPALDVVLDGVYNYAYERACGLFQYTHASNTSDVCSTCEYHQFKSWCISNGLDWSSADTQLEWTFGASSGVGRWADRWLVGLARSGYYSNCPGYSQTGGQYDSTPEEFMTEGSVIKATYSWMACYERCANGSYAHLDKRIAYALEYYEALTVYSSCNPVREQLVEYAKSFVGKIPYVWGGESLSTGVDCSGFTMKVYEHFYSELGITLAHSSIIQSQMSPKIYNLSEVKPGDLIFYYAEDGSIRRHVSIYIGNGQVVEAADESLGIIIDDVGGSFAYAVQLIDDTQSVTGDDQQRIISACHSTASPGSGLCAKWVSLVYQNAGFSYLGGNACDQYYAYCTSSDRAELQPGMIIAVPHSPTSYEYGHVGIYIGNNLVMHSIGTVLTTDLDEWISTYSYQCTAKWGYPDCVYG